MMKNAIKVINEMVKVGLINDYAVGGGIAAMFYTEPFLTYDIDVFILIELDKEEKVVLLTPVYEYLKKKGYTWKGEHIIVEGIPVQFIPADELESVAIKDARKVLYEGVRIKVINPEYLIAILLRAGRKKDVEKVEKIMAETKIERKKLKEILKRYNLLNTIERLGLLR